MITPSVYVDPVKPLWDAVQ